MLGYPDQAQQRSHEALALARELSHPYDVVFALNQAVVLHQLRREGRAAYERAEEVLAFCTEQGFTQQLAMGTILRGWGLAAQGQVDRGIAQMHQGLAASQAAGIELGRAPVLAQLAEAYWHIGQTEEGLRLLAEALAVMDRTGERWWEAEVHRLKGELLLSAGKAHRQKASGSRGVFSAGPRRCTPPAGQVPGTAGGDESESAVAATGQARRGVPPAGRDIRLVHGRI